MKKQTTFGLTYKDEYNQYEVIDFKSNLQEKSGLRLNLQRPSLIEIVLTCHNINKYECGFKYLFRKKNADPELNSYLLLTQFQSHHIKCIEQTTSQKQDILASPSFRRYKPQLEIDNDATTPRIMSLIHLDALENSLEKEPSLQKQPASQKGQPKLYTEEEVALLKKELQFQSKGLISKSTQFHSELGYITKISFKCKFENNKCPYLSILTYTFDRNSKNQKLYRLDRIVRNHLPCCLLDEEEIHYNAITRKIDQNLQKIVHILADHHQDIKPKKVLELFSIEMQQTCTDFLYHGITSKINRRAVKKYFDNSVAKARNMLK